MRKGFDEIKRKIKFFYAFLRKHNCLHKCQFIGGNSHIIINSYHPSMSEALPKYMLLDENSEQIRDRRIMPVTDYKEQGDRAIVTKNKVITNTLSLPWKPSKKSSIFNIQYSSKYGILLLATDNQVVIKTTKQLEKDLLTAKLEQATSMSIKFSGELFLSPNEEIIAIVSESLLQFAKISSLNKSSNMQVPPVPNLNQSNHFLWVDNSHFLAWKFEGKALLYTINQDTLAIKNQEELPSECCTGASVIHDHLFLIEKMKITIFSPFTTDKPVIKAQIDMTDENHESPYFQYSYIIDIFKINIKETTFTPNDIFGLAVVFYDQDEDATDERYLTFATGDIFSRDSLELRGYENFYSSKTERELFYINEEDKEKASFGIKRVISNGFICIMLEKSQKVYIIDPLESFDRLNIFDIKSKHELKHDEGKFFQGIALMQNMLPIQRIAPNKAENLLKKIVANFNGQFMSLYFKEKETNLTIPFPPSILAIGGQKLYRRYAISTIDGIDDDNDDVILEKIGKIKKSPHILDEKDCKKFSEDVENKDKEKEEKQVPKTIRPGKREENQAEIKAGSSIFMKDDKKQSENNSASNPFKLRPSGTAESAASLFDKVGEKPSNQLFGPSKSSSLFANVPNLFAGASISMPGQSASSQAEKQEKKDNNATNLFGGPTKPQPSVFGNGIFSQEKPQASKQQKKDSTDPIFGIQNKQLLFSVQANNIFGNKLQNKVTASDANKNDQPLPTIPKETKPEVKQKDKIPAEKTLFGQIAPPSAGFSLFNKAPQNKQQQTGNLLGALASEKNAGTSTTNVFGTKQSEPFKGPSFSSYQPNTSATLKDQQNLKKEAKEVNATQIPKANFFPKATQTSQNFFGVSPSTTLTSPAVKKQENIKPVLTVPSPTENAVQVEKLNKKKTLFEKIRSSISGFVAWQKQNFENQSSSSQNSFSKIMEKCKQEEQTIKNLDHKIFGQSLEEIKQSILISSKSDSKINEIIANKAETIQQTQAEFNQRIFEYENMATKMIYYINKLSKKRPVNVRASMTQSQFMDKAVNSLRRITDENERKIANLEQQSINIENIIYKLIEQRSNKRKKRQKQQKRVFNFQDYDEEDTQLAKMTEKITNSHAHHYQFTSSKIEIKPALISLNTTNQTPKIELLPFETKAPVQAKQPTQKKIEAPAQKQNVPAGSFIDKIPPKKEKVQVPIIPKIEEKKDQEKQAISQGVSDASEAEIELPTARRQISSIQPAQVKGLKPQASTQADKKGPVISIKPPAEDNAVKTAQTPIFGKKTQLQPPKVEQPMLVSLTTSIFNNTKAAPATNLFGNKKADESTQKKQTEIKPATSLFGNVNVPSTSPFAAVKVPAAQPKRKQAKEEVVKPEVKKQSEGQPKKEEKSSGFSLGQASGGSLFSLNPNAPPLGGGSLFNLSKKSEQVQPTQQKGQNQKKPEGGEESKSGADKKETNNLGSLLGGLSVSKKQGDTKDTVPQIKNENKNTASLFPSPSSTAGTKAQTKPAETKPSGSLFAGTTLASGSNSLPSGLFGDKKAEPTLPPTQKKPQNTLKQETTQNKPEGSLLNPTPTTSVLAGQQTSTSNDNKDIVTDEVAQSNSANKTNAGSSPSLTPSTNDSFFNKPANQQQKPAGIFAPQSSNQTNPAVNIGAFNSGSIFPGSSPAPQFGVGNNKFMNSANTQQPKTTGFDPNAAKFGYSSNNQKSFSNISSSDGNIFQQQQQQNQQNAPSNNVFPTQANMFNQNSNPNQGQNSNPIIAPSFNTAPNNQMNNNQTNIFNPSNNAGGSNAFMSASFGNNSQSQQNSFNNMNSNSNTNNFPFGNNNNSNFNNPNPLNTGNNMFNPNNQGNMFSGNNMIGGNTSNANSMFNNTGSSSGMFGNNNNSNQNSFLSKLNAGGGPIAPPPTAMNSHLMQMRK